MNRSHLYSSLVRILLAEADACQKAGHTRTAANYRSAVFKAVLYAHETHSRLPARIDTRWMKMFSCWLTHRHAASPATVSFYLRTFRAVCRRARVYDLSPGGDFHLPRQQACHRALSADELRRLFLPDAAGQLSTPMAQTLDVLRFMFCLCGLAFRDVRNLRHDMIDTHWHLTCRRSKTGAQLHLHIPPRSPRHSLPLPPSGQSLCFPLPAFRCGRKTTEGRKRLTATQSPCSYPGLPAWTGHSAHYLRHAPHVGHLDARNRQARRAHQPMPWPQFYPNYTNLLGTNFGPSGRNRSGRHADPNHPSSPFQAGTQETTPHNSRNKNTPDRNRFRNFLPKVVHSANKN